MNPYVFLIVFTGAWVLATVVAWFTVIRHERSKRKERESVDSVMFIILARALKTNLARSPEPRNLLPADREYEIAVRFIHTLSLSIPRSNRPILLDELQRESDAFEPNRTKFFYQQLTNVRPS